MKILSILSFLTVLLVPTNEYHWPEDWNSHMVLSVYYKGGMNPESWKIKITNSTCVYERHYGDQNNTYDFYPTKQDLRNLIKVLKDNHLTKIKTHVSHGITFDKPTFGFVFQADDKVYSANSGGEVEVDHKWAQSFTAIEDSVMALAQKHLQKQKITIIFKIDPSVQDAGKNFHFDIAHGDIIQYNANQIPDMLEEKLLPGEYHLHIYLSDEGENKPSKSIADVRAIFETSRAREFLIKMDGKKLVFEPR